VTGTVVDVKPGFTFSVELDDIARVIDAVGAGRLRKHRVRITRKDKVLVEINRYNPELGRIVRRLNNDGVNTQA